MGSIINKSTIIFLETKISTARLTTHLHQEKQRQAKEIVFANVDYPARFFASLGIKGKYALFALIVLLALQLKAQNINIPNKMGPLSTNVNTLSGNLFTQRTDISIPARGIDIEISFAYNTFNYYQKAGYGNGWSFRYGMAYRLDANGIVTIVQGDNREDSYTPTSSGGLTPPTGIFDQLTQYQTGKYLLVTKYGTKYYFDNATHKRVTKIQDASNNYLAFTYQDSLINSITNAAGQTINLTYNNGLLATVVDAIASPTRTFTYKYDGYGNLTQVTDPLGNKIAYQYLVNGPLSGITDKNGNAVDIIYYPNFTVSELIGCNSRKSFSYDTVSNTTVVTDYVPNSTDQVTTYNFKTYNGKTWLSHMNGNCCGYNLGFEYDNSGNLIKKTDANGNVETYTYDGNGNPLTATDALGNKSSFTFDSQFSQLTSVTDENGNHYTFDIDNAGNITKETAPGNLQTSFAFAPNGDLLSTTDPKGNVWNFTYDTYGFPKQVTNPLGNVESYINNPRGFPVSNTDAAGNTATANFDALNRLTKITDVTNHSKQLTYDANGNITVLTDRKGNTMLVGYDASNRPVSMTDPTGNKTQMAWDAQSNLLKLTDPLGKSTSFAYDNLNRLASFTDAIGNTYTYSYDYNGNITSVNYPNGNVVNCAYDKMNRLVKVSDSYNVMGSISYDANGNPTSLTNAAGTTTSLLYDALDRPIQMIDAFGNKHLYGYDNNSNVVSVVDRNNRTSTYSYDALNRLLAFTDNNNNSSSVTFDASGNVKTIVDAKGNTTTYTYNSLQRMTDMTYADGSTMHFAYDVNGKLITQTQPNGATIGYQYDAFNRRIAKTLPSDNYTYTYDAKGRLTAATNATGTIAMAYDAIDRPISELVNGHTTSYSYNNSGTLLNIVYPDHSTVTKNFDNRWRLINIKKSNADLATYQYNNATGQLQQLSYGNGVVTNWQYDQQLRITSLATQTSNLPNLAFTYDNESNITTIARANFAQASEQFSYDAKYRLTGFTQGSLQNTYNYDKVGNRTTAILNGVSNTYTANTLNQYTNLNNANQTINFTYDGNGNLTYDGFFYKRYDIEGRLLVDSTASVKIQYQYDAVGRRAVKTVNGKSTNYFYAGLSQLEQRDAATDTVLNETVFYNPFKPIVTAVKQSNYYYHSNHLNSVEAISDASGNLVERYQYDAYGKPTLYDAAGNPVAVSSINRFGYTGQEYDAETGSNHFLYRNYNPNTGNFNQRDPLGYTDGIGIYQYVHDNPSNKTDPLGLEIGQDYTAQLQVEDISTPCEKLRRTLLAALDGQQVSANDLVKILSNFSDFQSILSAAQTQTVDGDIGKIGALGSQRLAPVMVPFAVASFINSALDLNSNWSQMDGMGKAEGLANLTVSGGSVVSGTAQAATYLNGLATVSEDAGAQAATDLVLENVFVRGLAIGGGEAAIVAQLANPAIAYATEKFSSGEWFMLDPGQNNPAGWAKWHANNPGNTWEDAEKRREEREIAYQRLQEKLAGEFEAKARRAYLKWMQRLLAKLKCPENNNNNGNEKKTPPNPIQTGIDIVTNNINSQDPNEIIGPTGVGTPQFVSAVDQMPYTINFENSINASAPAKTVRVNYPIDAKQDMGNISLGSFGFNNLTYNVPPNTPSFYQRIDARDSIGLYVDVTAGLDVTNRQIFWVFQSIDPVTLLSPSDPLKGFLLLTDTSKPTSGHGFVNFFTKPVSNAVTGDTVHAAATIVFDGNDTVPTNVAKNTIDAVAPTSHMNALPANSASAKVPLTWTAADDAKGSGVKSYSLYVSVNSGAFGLYATNISKKDTTFTGASGNSYSFFVLGTDSVGNTETLKPGAEATTYINAIALPVTWLYFNAVSQGKDGFLTWATATETNSKSFDIERSIDGRNFTKIGATDAAGNSTVQTNYTYTDVNVVALNIPVVYYRLKQIDKDGKATYSNIVAVQLPVINVGPIVQAYPNPFKQTLNILIANMTALDLSDNIGIYTLEGKKVYEKQIGQRLLNTTITLTDLPTLTPGMYILKLGLNKQTYSFKLMKQ